MSEEKVMEFFGKNFDKELLDKGRKEVALELKAEAEDEEMKTGLSVFKEKFNTQTEAFTPKISHPALNAHAFVKLPKND
jgi:hypothetical protein